MPLSTHRLLQLHGLADDLASRAARYRRAADKAAGINNAGATVYFLRRAIRMERILAKCLDRLEK